MNSKTSFLTIFSLPFATRVARLAAILLSATAASAICSAPAAAAADPSAVNFTLEGCRNNGNVTLPDGSGRFVCPDAAYTTGNLGKGWNELDLVPFRLTAQAGNSAPASQTYAMTVVLDNVDASRPGYDVLSAPVLNSALSSPSCTAASYSGQTSLTPGIGGTDVSIYRRLTITQAQNSSCVYDFYGRLALGSHLYPGSSLHANAANQNLGTAGIGARDVSIPVREILPQTIDKTMTARQDASQSWSVSKSGPSNVDFGDVCSADGPQAQPLQITVSWSKIAATPGRITAVATISATNPAARTITVTATDRIYEGPSATPGALLHTSTFAPVDVPASTTLVVGTDTVELASSVATLGEYLSDVATATYTDLATGIAVPGQTTAISQTQIQSGNTSNTSASIADTESISGAGLSYSVAPPLVGSFSGYSADSATTGNVLWQALSQSDSGSVTFSKTLYLDGRRIVSGTLSDQASLTGSDGFAAQSDVLNVLITSSASVALTLSKSVPDFLSSGEKLEVVFHVTRAHDTSYHQDITLSFLAGGSGLQTTTLTGLVPDVYSVSEGDTTFYPADYPTSPSSHPKLVPLEGTLQTADLTVGLVDGQPVAHCADTVTFNNVVPTTEIATATVEKLSFPALETSDADYYWSFTLTGPLGSGIAETLTTVGANAGPVGFGSPLTSEGSYTVTETTKTGWDLNGAAPNNGSTTTVCTFTVDYPQDAGKVFGCAFTNTRRGRAEVIKTVDGQALSGSQSFAFQLRQGASLTSAGTTLESGTANAGNGGSIHFSTRLVPGSDYQLCEVVMPGWLTNLGTLVPGSFLPPDGIAPDPNLDNSTVCVNFSVSAGETRVFTVDNHAPPGGSARTIGYWKNWASCSKSGGKQAFVLDQTLAAFPSHGFFVGTLLVDTCAEAVSLLNKSTLTGKKMASDPAFNMAAQLVAAVLNIEAGAGSCPGVIDAINQAQALLVKYQFNGLTHTAISAADAQLMRSLAATLDAYNNNRYCGSVSVFSVRSLGITAGESSGGGSGGGGGGGAITLLVLIPLGGAVLLRRRWRV